MNCLKPGLCGVMLLSQAPTVVLSDQTVQITLCVQGFDEVVIKSDLELFSR